MRETRSRREPIAAHRRRSTPPTQDLLEVLEDLEQSKNYSAWILDLIGPHVNGRILEVGAGPGHVFRSTSPTTDTSRRSSRPRPTARRCASG